ncbi:hypothetical protein AXF42_Ash008894 [Apostasia shenzhenica]|uniref:Uncharacterized protein n=1 Tax=Apostasia shenzhenica TaxID=1088818 RepID=A0A2I0ASV7_9ASPA|nr:hypothetical protein AXF42_Ash008894 [Apostasia shenzhenica]
MEGTEKTTDQKISSGTVAAEVELVKELEAVEDGGTTMQNWLELRWRMVELPISVSADRAPGIAYPINTNALNKGWKEGGHPCAIGVDNKNRLLLDVETGRRLCWYGCTTPAVDHTFFNDAQGGHSTSYQAVRTGTNLRLDVFRLRGDYLPFALTVRLVIGAALHVYARDAALQITRRGNRLDGKSRRRSGRLKRGTPLVEKVRYRGGRGGIPRPIERSAPVLMFDLEDLRLRGDYLPFALTVRLVTGVALHVYAPDAALQITR